MAIREIGARISLDGEKEFKSQLKAVNSNLKTLKSELVANAAEFDGCANSAEALRRKQAILQDEIAQQKKKVEALTQAVEDATAEYGENSKQVDDLKQSLNYAKAAESKMNSELQDTEKYLQEAEDAADDCATSIDEYGKKVKEADDKSGGLLDAVTSLVPGLDKLTSSGGLTAAAIGGGLVAAAGAAFNWAMNLVEETAELRTSLAKLESTASTLGMELDSGLTENLVELYTVADGDWDSAFEALQNLLNAGYEENSLPETISLLAGAVEAFPDTLKIESLADSLQETLATGAATGQFSELLDRLGISVDDFNLQLADCNGTLEAQQLVSDTLANGGLAEVNAAYETANAEQLALMESEANLELANATLAEAFIPLKTHLTDLGTAAANLGANFLEAWNHGGTLFESLVVGFQSGKAAGDEAGVSMSEMWDIMDDLGLSFSDLKAAAEENDMSMGEYINTLRDVDTDSEDAESSSEALSGSLDAAGTSASNAATQMNRYAAAARSAASVSSVSGVSGNRHANGLDYVPYDGYAAILHKGEQVLTAEEAKGGGRGVSIVVNTKTLSQSEVDYLVQTVNRRLGT